MPWFRQARRVPICGLPGEPLAAASRWEVLAGWKRLAAEPMARSAWDRVGFVPEPHAEAAPRPTMIRAKDASPAESPAVRSGSNFSVDRAVGPQGQAAHSFGRRLADAPQRRNP